MRYLHHVLRVPPAARAAFLARLRDDWLPAVARGNDARLAWVASSMDLAVRADEICTITVLRDDAALAGFAERVRTGDLAALAAEVTGATTSMETRMLAPLRYNRFEFDLDAIPAEPVEAPTTSYMHDFVPPVIGQNRGYEDLMEARYMALSDTELSNIVLRGSFETVAGGGPMPEHFNLSEIRITAGLVQLLAYEIPREYKAMGTWMWEALGVRDRWTTRLVRSATWSPVR